ncbi:hypothetical protein N7467_007969 [Penicillium canescens]|nr:hypothetical protein N7467_007969 [Penicillium canescens]
MKPAKPAAGFNAGPRPHPRPHPHPAPVQPTGRQTYASEPSFKRLSLQLLAFKVLDARTRQWLRYHRVTQRPQGIQCDDIPREKE